MTRCRCGREIVVRHLRRLVVHRLATHRWVTVPLGTISFCPAHGFAWLPGPDKAPV